MSTMTGVVLAMMLALLVPGCGGADGAGYTPREGDLVFHQSRSDQSPLIQIATKSRYSHVGIVHFENGAPLVLEAVSTVRSTPLDTWIARGEDGHFVAMRLRAEVLEGRDVARVREAAAPFLGLPYDWNFEWSDDRMYCSELVWKILDRGLGIQVGEARALGTYDREDPEVGRELRERFGDEIPLDQSIVSPVAMMESELLVEVHRN